MILQTDTTLEFDIQKIKSVIKYCTRKYSKAVIFARKNKSIYKIRLNFILFQFKTMFFQHWIN